MQKGQKTGNEDAAKNRHEIVEADDECGWLDALIVEDEIDAHLEQLVTVEDCQNEYDDLHSCDCEDYRWGWREGRHD